MKQMKLKLKCVAFKKHLTQFNFNFFKWIPSLEMKH